MGALVAAFIFPCLPPGLGCSIGSASRGKKLLKSSYLFNLAVRWRRHHAAAGTMDPALRDHYLSHVEEEEGKLNVSQVDKLRGTVGKKGKTASLRYRYLWHRSNEGVVRKSIVVQHWKYGDAGWRVTRIERGPGATFPLFDGLDDPEKLKKKLKEKQKKQKKAAKKSGAAARTSRSAPP